MMILLGALVLLALALVIVADERDLERNRSNALYEEGFREGVKYERQRVTALLSGNRPRGLRALVVKHALSTDEDEYLLPRGDDGDHV